MISKKVCMIGSFSVGKTSLVRQYVHTMFDDKYQTTIGVKVDKKCIEVNNESVNLMLWDLAGEDEYNRLQTSFLRGSSGFILVADGTRKHTVDKALELHKILLKDFPSASYLMVLNKYDLTDEWQLSQADIDNLKSNSLPPHLTSARTASHVDEIFQAIAQSMLTSGNK
jgi:small GTP-binding protein